MIEKARQVVMEFTEKIPDVVCDQFTVREEGEGLRGTTWKKIDTIQAERVKRLLDSGAKVVLVDLRPAKEFQETRLPGARSIPMTELPKRFEEIPKAGQVVLYCACTISEIAERAAFLGFRGYRNIFVLLDGYPGWVKRGYPLETGRR